MEILSPLSFVVLLFLLLSFPGATNNDLPGSGDGNGPDGGPDVEEDDDIICINPHNFSSLHPSYFYEGSNFTLGLQHGSCMSACLNQVYLHL